MKKSFFAAGVLFGTFGIKILTSDAAHPRRPPLYRVLQPAFDSARRGRSACTDRFRASAQSFHLGHFAQEHDRSFAETAGKSGRTADRIKPQRRQKILPPLFCTAKTTAREMYGRLSLFALVLIQPSEHPPGRRTRKRRTRCRYLHQLHIYRHRQKSRTRGTRTRKYRRTRTHHQSCMP